MSVKFIGDFMFSVSDNKLISIFEEAAAKIKVKAMMDMHYQFYGKFQEENKYVKSGSILWCSEGNKLTKFDILKDHGVEKDGTPLGICSDCKVNRNIYSFGVCEKPTPSGYPQRPSVITTKNSKSQTMHICIPMLKGEWSKTKSSKIKIWDEEKGKDCDAITTGDFLTCFYGGIISVVEVPEEGSSEEGPIKMSQMTAFNFSITTDELKKLNKLLKDNGITNNDSIALFMATCGHESSKGKYKIENGDEAYFKSNGYSTNTRGAGYIQVTKTEQEDFYEYIGKNPPVNRAQDIADNYAWEAAVWEWAAALKGSGVIMNDYVESYGSGENIYLVTQYFINSYLDKKFYPHFDSDLSDIRKGVTYSYDINQKWKTHNGKEYTGVLKVNDRTYRLPLNYPDRLKNYNEAKKIWKKG